MEENIDKDMEEERNEETEEEVATFLSPWYTAVKTFHRLFDAAQDDTITPDQIFAEFGRDPHRAGNTPWLDYRMREFRRYGLVEATYQSTDRPRRGRKRLKDFRLTPKGKQALARYEAELKDETELKDGAEGPGKTVTQGALQEASQAQTVPTPSPLAPPSLAPKKWVSPQKEALTFDSALLFLIEWQRENPSFGLTVEISVEGAVALAVRLKGKG